MENQCREPESPKSLGTTLLACAAIVTGLVTAPGRARSLMNAIQVEFSSEGAQALEALAAATAHPFQAFIYKHLAFFSLLHLMTAVGLVAAGLAALNRKPWALSLGAALLAVLFARALLALSILLTSGVSGLGLGSTTDVGPGDLSFWVAYYAGSLLLLAVAFFWMRKPEVQAEFAVAKDEENDI